MSQYRDELEAARRRLDTLEAKVRERDAALEVRELELAEREAEIAMLRRSAGEGSPPLLAPLSRGRLLGIFGLGAIASCLSIGVAVLLVNGPCRYEGELLVEPAALPEPPAQVQADEPEALAPALLGAAEENARSTDVQIIKQGITQAKRKVRACYQQELASRPDSAGSIQVTLEIDQAGAVSDITLSESTVRSPAFDACLTRVYRELKFAGLEQGATTVSTSFTFVPAAPARGDTGF
ncbi:AgmX/PglI C-terminal domain-containing protein [Sorangium sp. So ce131]|uniref:AgmX/PglI C-terminal domain-containing protein n=1 Tax=Sorangium sp. So ce131 TaxID=3133282 RepID=UPI003F63F7B5